MAQIRAEDLANKPADSEAARRDAIERVIKPAYAAGNANGVPIWVNMERGGARLSTAEWEPALKAAGLKFAALSTIVGEAADPPRPGQLGLILS
jgi:hypothetical protein